MRPRQLRYLLTVLTARPLAPRIRLGSVPNLLSPRNASWSRLPNGAAQVSDNRPGLSCEGFNTMSITDARSRTVDFRG